MKRWIVGDCHVRSSLLRLSHKKHGDEGDPVDQRNDDRERGAAQRAISDEHGEAVKADIGCTLACSMVAGGLC